LKYVSLLCLALFLALGVATAQNGPVRTDVYHVHFTVAAPGKAAQLGQYLKTSSPAGHSLVLRHQDGAEWDYVVIEHLGTKATVEAAGNPPPASARDLSAWHGDTFVNGPAWADFVKAMGLGDDADKTTGSVYVVSTYRAIPGHRDPLEKMLGTAPGSGDKVAGMVLLQHLEGAPWNFLGITRYNSWQDFAASEVQSVAQTAKGSGGWYELREHTATHNDTLADRVAP
jgi:hypothetical protein